MKQSPAWRRSDEAQKRIVLAYPFAMPALGRGSRGGTQGALRSHRARAGRAVHQVHQQRPRRDQSLLADADAPAEPRACPPRSWRRPTESETAEPGPGRSPSTRRCIIPFMEHSRRSRSSRAALPRVHHPRLGRTRETTLPSWSEYLLLRQERGPRSSVPAYAEVILASKMAPFGVARSTSCSKSCEAQRCRVRAPSSTSLVRARRSAARTLWDIAFWAERLQRRALCLQRRRATTVLLAARGCSKGSFATAKRLFEVDIRPADGEVPVWDPRRALLSRGRTRAETTLAASTSILTAAREQAGRGVDGRSVAQATKDQRTAAGRLPGLQHDAAGRRQAGAHDFREVETLFHEFGHGLQHMLTHGRLSVRRRVSTTWSGTQSSSPASSWRTGCCESAAVISGQAFRVWRAVARGPVRQMHGGAHFPRGLQPAAAGVFRHARSPAAQPNTQPERGASG